MKKENFYLVFEESDGWVVHKSLKSAKEDYKNIDAEDNKRIIKVTSFEELTKREDSE
jgi:hypothetical protein